MLRKLLCALGFHNWKYRREVMPKGTIYYFKTCDCGCLEKIGSLEYYENQKQ